MAKPKVVIISGSGRSGSTVLGLTLDSIGDVVFVGELKQIWQRGFIDNQLTGSKQPFKECPFWKPVIHEAFGSETDFNVWQVLSAQRGIDRLRYLPSLQGWLPSPDIQAKLAIVHEAYDRLYHAIYKLTHCSVIVDSSKAITHNVYVNGIDSIIPYTIHLVRDSRAVAWSWMQKKIRPEVVGSVAYMPQQSLARSAMNWNIQNFALGQLRQDDPRYLCVRYEDFTANPIETVSKITRLYGDPTANINFLRLPSFRTEGNHTLSGNPMRFQETVTIKPDDRWVTDMPPQQKRWVTSLTFPLLFEYGYLGGEHGKEDHDRLDSSPTQSRMTYRR
ncbi:MAG: sulfotransferase [Phototrophicaceae bacterium]